MRVTFPIFASTWQQFQSDASDSIFLCFGSNCLL